MDFADCTIFLRKITMEVPSLYVEQLPEIP